MLTEIRSPNGPAHNGKLQRDRRGGQENSVYGRTAVYLFVEPEPLVADAVAAGGGGIMFHVSARYFQSAPS